MEQWLNAPFTLRMKVFLILFMGIGSLFIAAIVFFLSHDRLLLVLSGIIFGGCLFRSAGLLVVLLRGDYETITGICTAVSSLPLRRYRKIELTDSQGAAIILLLGKQVKIKPGGCYCFYFRSSFLTFLSLLLLKVTCMHKKSGTMPAFQVNSEKPTGFLF